MPNEKLITATERQEMSPEEQAKRSKEVWQFKPRLSDIYYNERNENLLKLSFSQYENYMQDHGFPTRLMYGPTEPETETVEQAMDRLYDSEEYSEMEDKGKHPFDIGFILCAQWQSQQSSASEKRVAELEAE